MRAPTTDDEIEDVLGLVTGVRQPTYEEEAEMLAHVLVERANRRPRSRRVLVSAALLRYVAARLDGLAALAQEGV